jgi:GNAT superfamily N-acetyltransferase
MALGPLWRLTRNRYGRACYDWLARRGVTATRMYEYAAPTGGVRVPAPARDAALATLDPAAVDRSDDPFDELLDEEVAVAAADGGEFVGYLFLSPPGVAHEVTPLGSTLAFDGSYVRRAFVDPDARRRGIATALIAAARRVAAERFDADRAVALVAADNRPSRRAFARNEFAPRRVHTYARAGSRSWRRVHRLED